MRSIGLTDLTAKIEDVILGCAFPEGEQGLNIARNAIFLTSLPATTSGETINRFCASGLQAIAHGAMCVQTGIAGAVLAGGVESMSSVPMGGNKVSLHPKLVDENPEVYIGMGHTAERVANALKSREKSKTSLQLGHMRKLLRPLPKVSLKRKSFLFKLESLMVAHFQSKSSK